MWLNKFVVKSNVCAKPHYSYTQPLANIKENTEPKPLNSKTVECVLSVDNCKSRKQFKLCSKGVIKFHNLSICHHFDFDLKTLSYQLVCSFKG